MVPREALREGRASATVGSLGDPQGVRLHLHRTNLPDGVAHRAQQAASDQKGQRFADAAFPLLAESQDRHLSVRLIQRHRARSARTVTPATSGDGLTVSHDGSASLPGLFPEPRHA